MGSSLVANMTKKSGKGKSRRGGQLPRQSPQKREIVEQRKSLRMLREMIGEMHDVSLDIMGDLGILPPLYGGEHLGDHAEAIGMWGTVRNSEDPVLVMLLLRVLPGTEPNADLAAMRRELELVNDVPMEEVLGNAVPEDKRQSGGWAQFIDLSVMMILGSDQLEPPAGVTREAMLEHMGAGGPFAVLPIIPVVEAADGEEETPYDWDDLDNTVAEVICADTPELLEAAIWDYRLRLTVHNMAGLLDDDDQELAAQLVEQLPEGVTDDLFAPELDPSDLAGIYDLEVMHAARFYGSTSPLRAVQEQLDIMREENGDLIVRFPLKPEIEPVTALAQARQALLTSGNTAETAFLLPGSDPFAQTLWTQLRAFKYFAVRVRPGNIVLDPRTKLPVANGFLTAPMISWMTADSLDELYNAVHLVSMRELLIMAHLMKGEVAMPPTELSGPPADVLTEGEQQDDTE